MPPNGPPASPSAMGAGKVFGRRQSGNPEANRHSSAALREAGDVLSQDDQRRLASIAAWTHAEDASFADGLAHGRPRCPRGDRRWPFQLLVAAGIVVMLVGLNHAMPVLIGLGAAAAITGWRADRRRRASRHRAPSNRHR